MIILIYLLVVTLAAFSAFLPYTFLGNFVLFHFFFHFDYKKFEIIGLEISTYKVFTTFFLLFYLSINFRSFNKQRFIKLLLALTVLVTSIFIVGLVHYINWGYLPDYYLSTHLKSLWPLLLICFDTPEINKNKILKYLGITFIVISLISLPSFVKVYWDYGSSIWRVRYDGFMQKYNPTFFYKNEQLALYSFTEMDQLLCTLTFMGLIYYVLTQVKKLKKYSLAIFFGIYILLMGPFKMLAGFITSILSYIFIYTRKPIKFKFYIAMATLFSLFLILLATESRLHILDRFSMEKIDFSTEKNLQARRLSKYIFTLNKITNTGLKGAGFPRTFDDEEILPAGVRYRAAVGHSNQIDALFYFGILTGILATIFNWLPFLYFFATLKKLSDDMTKIYFYFNISAILLLFSIIGIWGETTTTLIVNVFVLYLLLDENIRRSSNEY